MPNHFALSTRLLSFLFFSAIDIRSWLGFVSPSPLSLLRSVFSFDLYHAVKTSQVGLSFSDRAFHGAKLFLSRVPTFTSFVR